MAACGSSCLICILEARVASLSFESSSDSESVVLSGFGVAAAFLAFVAVPTFFDFGVFLIAMPFPGVLSDFDLACARAFASDDKGTS